MVRYSRGSDRGGGGERGRNKWCVQTAASHKSMTSKLLEGCDGCDLVKYLAINVRKITGSSTRESANKRKAELHDKELFQAARRQSSPRMSDLIFAAVA